MLRALRTSERDTKVRRAGKATAYYYGYLGLRALRTQAKVALGKRFDLMAFNDFIIAQGLLPPRILLMGEFVPAQR